MMKIRPNRAKNTWIFFAIVIVVAVLYWLSFVGFTLKAHWFHYLFMAIWLIPSFVIYLLSYYRCYYILTETELIQRQLVRIIHIPYDNIAYIDVKASLHDRNLYLILHDKLPLILTQDKGHLLLEEMQKRCHKLLTIEELKEKGYLEWQKEAKYRSR